MPYIPQQRRKDLQAHRFPVTSGELNYLITELVDDFLQQSGPLTYDTINRAIGVLECAKLELYRRVAVPYEKDKIEENGDVYSVDGGTSGRDPGS